MNDALGLMILIGLPLLPLGWAGVLWAGFGEVGAKKWWGTPLMITFLVFVVLGFLAALLSIMGLFEIINPTLPFEIEGKD